VGGYSATKMQFYHYFQKCGTFIVNKLSQDVNWMSMFEYLNSVIVNTSFKKIIAMHKALSSIPSTRKIQQTK
jgi:hypothetical protein